VLPCNKHDGRKLLLYHQQFTTITAWHRLFLTSRRLAVISGVRPEPPEF